MIEYRRQVTLDLTPDGQFARRRRLPVGMRIGIAAVVVALVAGGVLMAALVIGLALVLVPITAIAVAVAYAAFRIEAWRGRRSAGGRDLFRP